MSPGPADPSRSYPPPVAYRASFGDMRRVRPSSRKEECQIAEKDPHLLPLLITVLLAGCTTKRAAVESLSPGAPQEVIRETVRLNLTFNDSAAMGLPAGEHGVDFIDIGVGALRF